MRLPDFRLAASVLGLLLVLGMACAGVMAWASGRHYDELTQRLNASIAMYVNREGPLMRDGHADLDRVQQISRHAMVVNPLAQIYLLDKDGRVIAGGSGKVDPVPIRRWLAGASGPVYGDDPARPSHRIVFSAHPLTGNNGDDGYVYVVLGGDRTSSLAAGLYASRVLLVSVVLLTAIMGATALLSVTLDRRMRRAQAQLDVLKVLDQDRRRLFESIGHDLRTPLAAACGYLEALERDGDRIPEPMRFTYVQVAHQHCLRLNRLVMQVFRLARLDSPRTQVQLEPVLVQELAQDVGARFERDATAGSRRMALEIDRDAPCVLANYELLETILENLLDNAIRHSESTAAIRLVVISQPGQVAVCVQDFGCGIASDNRETGDSATRSSGGLGLEIVRRALQVLGTSLEICAEPGRGTAMIFVLPVMNS